MHFTFPLASIFLLVAQPGLAVTDDPQPDLGDRNVTIMNSEYSCNITNLNNPKVWKLYETVPNIEENVCYTLYYPARAIRLWDPFTWLDHINCTAWLDDDCQGLAPPSFKLTEHLQCYEPTMPLLDWRPWRRIPYRSFKCMHPDWWQ